jgi:hypothetical protein
VADGRKHPPRRKSKSINKKEQAQLLEAYSTENNLWLINSPSEERYLTRGGEARVFLPSDFEILL